MQKEGDLSLLKFFLPEGILEYFNISKAVNSETAINIHLEEKNITPVEYSAHKLTSKGFFDEITVQDFPVRGKSVFLKIKRRRWVNKTTGETVFRQWDMVAKGTRITEEFAAFLKEIARHKAR